MAREIVFLERARLELIEASLYLNKHQLGMGDELVAELDRLLERVAAFPQMCTEVDTNTRRAVTRRFTYSLFYQHDAERIYVLALLHQSRSPENWPRES